MDQHEPNNNRPLNPHHNKKKLTVHFDPRPPKLIPSSSHHKKKNKKKSKTPSTTASKRTTRHNDDSQKTRNKPKKKSSRTTKEEGFLSAYDPWYGPEDYERFRQAKRHAIHLLDAEEEKTWKDPTSRVNLLLALHQCTTFSKDKNGNIFASDDHEENQDDSTVFLTETQLARFDGLYDHEFDENTKITKVQQEDNEDDIAASLLSEDSSFSLVGMEDCLQIQLEQDKHQRRVNQYHLVLREIPTAAALYETPPDRLAAIVAKACACLSKPAGRLALFYGQSLARSLQNEDDVCHASR